MTTATTGNRGGLGCGGVGEGKCPENCLGDFTSNAVEYHKDLSPGFEIQLGLCEGHGAILILSMDEKGYYVKHYDLDSGKELPDLTRRWNP